MSKIELYLGLTKLVCGFDVVKVDNLVDVKVKAGVVVTGKVVAVDKDKAVVVIVWVTGLLVDIVVVVIITGELEIPKVV